MNAHPGCDGWGARFFASNNPALVQGRGIMSFEGHIPTGSILHDPQGIVGIDPAVIVHVGNGLNGVGSAVSNEGK